MRHVLVATDFSSRSEAAVERGTALALAGAAPMILVYVLPAQGLVPKALGPGDAMEWERVLAYSANEQLAVLAERVRVRTRLDVSTALRAGSATDEILRVANECAAEIVVLGAQGGHFVSEFVLGTTAEKVVRKGSRPVLVVRRSSGERYRSIAIAVDFSKGSAQGMALARQIENGADYHLVHVHDVWYLERLRGELGNPGIDRYIAVLKAELSSNLRAVAAAHHLPPERCWYHVLLGYPGLEIPRLAVTIAADLIVVGSRSANGLAGALLGSTSEHVLREATCDVLVAR